MLSFDSVSCVLPKIVEIEVNLFICPTDHLFVWLNMEFVICFYMSKLVLHCLKKL